MKSKDNVVINSRGAHKSFGLVSLVGRDIKSEVIILKIPVLIYLHSKYHIISEMVIWLSK